MRDLFLLALTLGGLLAVAVYPFAGVLLWTWYGLMSPQAQTFGFARTLPLASLAFHG